MAQASVTEEKCGKISINMANLFGKNKLREIAKTIDTESVRNYIDIVKEWHEDYHNGSLKKDKETSREQEYNHAFFKTILGYKEKPASPFSFEPKATTDKGQLPDAVISYTDTANEVRNIAAVVELKGASIDLDRPQRREGNMSPVQQGFKYKTQYRSVPFVVVSNFWEFRLYHDNLLDYEVWTLDDLINPDDDYILFKTWYALLKKDNFTTAKGSSKTENLLSDIRIEQENIGKKFYKVYKEARLDLLRDIYKHNDHIKTDIDTGIEKAQKIIDRIVFAAFAEDRGLLPDNTLQRVIKAADSSVFGGSLWNTLKGFFEAIDVGNDKLEIPNGYNGGLFKYDAVLNTLQISDEPLRKVAELGTYNFSEDLSVNILGHIFEQSISDLEEIKNKVNESQSLETISQSRRKKDGIFYTPDYIVRYIVDNSLGAYLREHEEKFKAEFGLKGDILDKTYEKREQQAYSKYQDFLQNIKVVDPACGSGAFLVYVFDYLLAENQRVGDIIGNTLFSSDEYVRDILRNNIYGVDLNEESVEITKLSLWLKTAQKGKKLTSLDDNIKCGNSLIDDPEIAGEKAFNWQEQFVDVSKSGGFDIVIGNPPYGAGFTSTEKTWIKQNYKLDTVNSDSYLIFFELCYKILKSDGFLGLITPNTYLVTENGKSVRTFLFEKMQPTVLLEVFNVFSDAIVEPLVSVFRKSANTTNYSFNVLTVGRKQTVGSDVLQSANLAVFKREDLFLEDNLAFNYRITKKQRVLIRGLYDRSSPIGDILAIKAGVKPYEKGKGTPPQTADTMKTKPFTGFEKIDSSWKKTIRGGDVKRYNLSDSREYIKYGKWLAAPRTPELFEKPKIVMRRTDDELMAAYDDSGAIGINSVHCIQLSKEVGSPSLLFVLGLLNSRLLNFVFRINNFHMVGKPMAEVKVVYVERLPYRHSVSVEQAIVGRVESVMELNADIQRKTNRLSQLLHAEYGTSIMLNRISRWWQLDFSDFTKSLKANLSLSQKNELLELFNEYRDEMQILDSNLQNADLEIDKLVYKLYDLTQDEIAVVEGRQYV